MRSALSVAFFLLGVASAACSEPLAVSMTTRPGEQRVYRLLEPGGFAEVVLGLTLAGETAGVDRLEVDLLDGDRPLRRTTLQAAAIAAHTETSTRNEAGLLLRDIAITFPAELSPTHVSIRAFDDRRKSAAAVFPVERYAQKNTYRLPLEGCWYVSSGHALGVEHRRHYSRAHFAWDFVQIDPIRAVPFRGQGASATDYFAFGQNVVAPADGKVVVADDTHPDNAPGETAADANHLLIDHGGGEHSKLAHLLQRSLLVKAGDQVVRGQRLARVGNSGRSDAPHLHLHFQQTTFDDRGVVTDERPIPVRLEVERTSNTGIREQETIRPRRGDFVCAPIAEPYRE